MECVTSGEWMSAQCNATLGSLPALHLSYVCPGWFLAGSVSQQLWPFKHRNGAKKPLMPMWNASCLGLVSPREDTCFRLWFNATNVTWPTAPAMQDLAHINQCTSRTGCEDKSWSQTDGLRKIFPKVFCVLKLHLPNSHQTWLDLHVSSQVWRKIFNWKHAGKRAIFLHLNNIKMKQFSSNLRKI